MRPMVLFAFVAHLYPSALYANKFESFGECSQNVIDNMGSVVAINDKCSKESAAVTKKTDSIDYGLFNNVYSTNGPCSPVIANNSGTVHVFIACGLDKALEEKVNQLPSVTEFNGLLQAQIELRNASETIYRQIQAIKGSDKTVKHELNQLGQLLNSHVVKNNRYQNRLETQSEMIAQEISRIPDIVNKSIRLTYERQLEEALKTETSRLHAAISDIQHDVDELYKKLAFLKNSSKNYLLFIGPSIGVFNPNEGNERHSKYGLEIDALLPTKFLRIRSSAFVEFVKLDWDTTLSFPTLPGLPDQTFHEDNSFPYIGLGGKVYFYNSADRFQLYTGGVYGTSINNEKEDTNYYSLLLGAEVFLTTTRIALELRYDGFSNIEEITYEFNPFGNPEVGTNATSKTGLFLGLKILFATYR